MSDNEIQITKNKMLNYNMNFSTNLIIICALGNQEVKNYLYQNMAKLLDFISKKKTVQILFNNFLWQKEEAKKIYELCKIETQKQIFFDFFEYDLRGFLSILKNCSVLIGNESGAANMAKALKIPTFSIYSPGINKNDWNIAENKNSNISKHYSDYFEIFEGNLFEMY